MINEMISKEELQEYSENSDNICSAHDELIHEFMDSMEWEARSFCLIYWMAQRSLHFMNCSSSSFKRYITKYSPSYIAMAEKWKYGWKQDIEQYNDYRRYILLFKEFMEQFRKDPENNDQKAKAVLTYFEKLRGLIP